VKIQPQKLSALNGFVVTDTRKTYLTLRRANFGYSVINKGHVAYFSMHLSEKPYFYFRHEIWRHNHFSRPQFSLRRGKSGEFANI